MSNQPIPAPHHPFRHERDLQLRFNDIDIFGHVNNAVYIQFMDYGKLHYFEQVMGRPMEQIGFAMVVANINCSFHAPATMRDELRVLTQCVHVGDKSLTLEQRIAGADGSVMCTARTVMVGYDPHTLAPVSVPDDARRRLSQYEGIDL